MRATHGFHWQGWGISLGLHVLLVFALFILRPGLGLTPSPEPFRWQVKMVQAPPSIAAQPAPVPAPVQKSSVPAESAEPAEAEMVVEKRPVQRAVEQVRPAQQRSQVVVESRVMTRETPVEHARAFVASRQVVQAAPETRQASARPQEVVRSQVETAQGPVRTVAAQIQDSHEVESREAPTSRQSIQAQSRGEGIVEAVSGMVVQRAPAMEHSMTRSETVQAERMDVKRSEAIVSAVHSVGQARAHYGWLKADLMAHIERLKRYPQSALDNKWEGRVVVRAVIREDGHLLDLSVVESSGHEVLDRESLELLKRVSPLPLKHQLGAPQVTLRIPINYGIR